MARDMDQVVAIGHQPHATAHQQVLHLAGFSDRMIMNGATQLAFNEMRDIKDMRATAKIYDLKLLEDEADMPAPIDATDS